MQNQERQIMGQSNSKPVFPAITCYLLSVICYLLSVLSCQTAPKTTKAIAFDDIKFLPLNSGAFAYILADVPHAQPILQYLKFADMDDTQLQQMIDQTQFAAAAMYLPNSARRYQLSAWGNYPASKAKMALGASKDWKKFRSSISGAEYWYAGGLSVAINPNQVFVVSAAKNSPPAPDDSFPPDPFSSAPGTAVPEGFNEFRTGAVFSCWIENPASFINQKLGEMGLPIEIPAERVLICLFPVAEQTGGEQQYEARLRIEVPSEAQARALTTLFAFARGFLSFNVNSSDGFAALAAIFFANPPVQEDRYLDIKTNVSGREIALLFNMFSL